MILSKYFYSALFLSHYYLLQIMLFCVLSHILKLNDTIFWDYSAISRVHNTVYSMLLFESQFVYFSLINEC